jgi:hypothetical protein
LRLTRVGRTATLRLPGASWSATGSTSTSTNSLPVDCPRSDNRANSVQEKASAPTTTSSTSRRIRTGTAGSEAAEFPSNSRSCRWGRRRKSWSNLVSIRKPRRCRFDMRFSAGKRRIFPALRPTGSLPVFRTWNSPPRNPEWFSSTGARFHLDAAMPAWMPSAATTLLNSPRVSRKGA